MTGARVTSDFLYFICLVFNNLFLCIDFPDEWAGFRFKGAWCAQNSGGTPIKQTESNKKLWAINP